MFSMLDGLIALVIGLAAGGGVAWLVLFIDDLPGDEEAEWKWEPTAVLTKRGWEQVEGRQPHA